MSGQIGTRARTAFVLAADALRPRSDDRCQRGRRAMKSPVVKRSVVLSGHKTSVSLEDALWRPLKEIAAERAMPGRDLLAVIDSERQDGNLSWAIRLFVLDFYPHSFLSWRRKGRDT